MNTATETTTSETFDQLIAAEFSQPAVSDCATWRDLLTVAAVLTGMAVLVAAVAAAALAAARHQLAGTG